MGGAILSSVYPTLPSAARPISPSSPLPFALDHVEVIEAVRRAINPIISQKDGEDDQIQIIEALSEGSFGKVRHGSSWVSI